MYAHINKKLIYLAYPRTASNRTAQALMRIGFDHVGKERKGHHSPLSEKSLKEFTAIPREKWTAFATVRNHWDIAVSFTHARGRLKPFTLERFKEALRPCWYIGEHDFFKFHTDQADAILKFENIQEDLNWFLELHGLGPVELEPQESCFAGSYHEYYTDETREYIYRRFQEEIEKYGYEF